MASFDKAIRWTLGHEGGLSNNANDRGGLTKWGITKATAADFGIAIEALTLAQALAIYRAKYWRHDGITSDRVATKAFDTGVNVGVARGIELLQSAANKVTRDDSSLLQVDGLLGPRSLSLINRLDERDLLEAMKDVQVIYYATIINGNAKEVERLIRRQGYDVPDDFRLQAVFVLGWMRRAIELP